MKILKLSFLVVAIATLFSSCRDKKNNDDVVVTPVEVKTVTNLHAPQQSDYTTTPPTISGEFVKFNFSTGSTTTSNTDWDIAFRGTTILVNGGTVTGINGEPARTGNAAAYIANGTFNDITSVNTSELKQDAQGALAIPIGTGHGWYLYNINTHTIAPIAGKVLVFRTHNGKYAKMEISSYYKDADNSDFNNGQYYSFKYVYQDNGTNF